MQRLSLAVQRGNAASVMAIAEDAVRTLAADLPACVIRPAIVLPSACEPAPGWVDVGNVFGPSGLLLGFGLGLAHTMLVDPEARNEMVQWTTNPQVRAHQRRVGSCFSPQTMWYCGSVEATNRYSYFFLLLFLHFIPAVLRDVVFRVTGSSFRLTQIYTKMYKLQTTLRYFHVSNSCSTMIIQWNSSTAYQTLTRRYFSSTWQNSTSSSL
ncbi:unnamed protein product [Plutella xylostella]|uniref:(diamondback moth) hypothetical protein n=1 Tax=Plutella xylostella TaxID=51655 RepID=A0A8S4FU20_PLUXY|nr:unnamed protein product [Plutella xylostella]